MKKIITLSLFLILSVSLFAGERSRLAYSGYSGGMMVHTGYLSAGTITINSGGESVSYNMSGAPVGIGGAMKFNFGGNLRLGMEGYASKLKYGVKGSYCSVGWGGFLADYVFTTKGRFKPFVGGTIGGGRVRNLTLATSPGDDYEAETGSSFRSYPVMMVTPFAGVEYAASDNMRVVLKADWSFAVANNMADYPSGFRIYIGFAFCRGK